MDDVEDRDDDDVVEEDPCYLHQDEVEAGQSPTRVQSQSLRKRNERNWVTISGTVVHGYQVDLGGVDAVVVDQRTFVLDQHLDCTSQRMTWNWMYDQNSTVETTAVADAKMMYADPSIA